MLVTLPTEIPPAVTPAPPPAATPAPTPAPTQPETEPPTTEPTDPGEEKTSSGIRGEQASWGGGEGVITQRRGGREEDVVRQRS